MGETPHSFRSSELSLTVHDVSSLHARHHVPPVRHQGPPHVLIAPFLRFRLSSDRRERTSLAHLSLSHTRSRASLYVFVTSPPLCLVRLPLHPFPCRPSVFMPLSSFPPCARLNSRAVSVWVMWQSARGLCLFPGFSGVESDERGSFRARSPSKRAVTHRMGLARQALATSQHGAM